MAKKTKVGKKPRNIAGIIAWIVGVLVSLSVGSGMAEEVLTIPAIYSVVGSNIITIVAGWIVIVGTILGIVMALFGK